MGHLLFAKQAPGSGYKRRKRQGCCIHGTHLLVEEREKIRHTDTCYKEKHVKGLGSNPSGGANSAILDRVIKEDLSKEVTTENRKDGNEETRPINIKWGEA